MTAIRVQHPVGQPLAVQPHAPQEPGTRRAADRSLRNTDRNDSASPEAFPSAQFKDRRAESTGISVLFYCEDHRVLIKNVPDETRRR